MSRWSVDLFIRPMRPDDLAEVTALVREAFRDGDERTTPRGQPLPPESSPEHLAAWRDRTAHLLDTDPAGCWVGESDGLMVGAALSFRRELTWVLASFAVRLGHQSAGVGRALLDVALTHSAGCLRGLLSASQDPRAYRRYWRAGFELYPELSLTGRVDRTTLPAVEGVREGTAADFELLDSVDRRVRGSAHGPDHEFLAHTHRLLVIERQMSSGYAWVRADGSPDVLAATGRTSATRLLWQALADAPTQVDVRHVTAANQWAIDIALTAGLSPTVAGHLGVRGMQPPAPYIHHGVLL